MHVCVSAAEPIEMSTASGGYPLPGRSRGGGILGEHRQVARVGYGLTAGLAAIGGLSDARAAPAAPAAPAAIAPSPSGVDATTSVPPSETRAGQGAITGRSLLTGPSALTGAARQVPLFCALSSRGPRRSSILNSVVGDAIIQGCTRQFARAAVYGALKWNFFGGWHIQDKGTVNCGAGLVCLSPLAGNCFNGAWQIYASGKIVDFNGAASADSGLGPITEIAGC
jgi:hypothetical protein